jgi:hypothetical protein
LWACAFIALWPSVLGYRSIRVVVVRDPEGVMDDCYLMSTNLKLNVRGIIRNFSLRWAIEVMFKASKQVMDIEDPHHFCQKSVEKVAPWVLGLQTQEFHGEDKALSPLSLRRFFLARRCSGGIGPL